jgi:hypothetical protein
MLVENLIYPFSVIRPHVDYLELMLARLRAMNQQ